MNILEKAKIVEVWLTNEDQQQPATDIEVRKICSEWGSRKYRVAVFRSGNKDLFSSAEGLILNNLAS